MKVGLYLVALHDRTLSSALDQMVAWGISDAEVAAGGFVPTPHCPTRELVANSDARQAWLQEFTSRGVRLTNQRSGSPCVQGQTWGYDGRGIWVDRGCRADFVTRR